MDRPRVKSGCCALAAALVVVMAGAIGLVQAANPAATAENAVLADLRLIESDTPVRQVPGWQPPKKIVVSVASGLGGNIEALRQVAPGVAIVLVKDRAETLAAVADAGAYIGACDPAVLVAAQRLFWLQTAGAGVEHCVTLPELRQRQILLTNAQHVAAPIIAEHVLALMFGLSRGFPVWMPAQAAASRASHPPLHRVQTDPEGARHSPEGLSGLHSSDHRATSTLTPVFLAMLPSSTVRRVYRQYTDPGGVAHE